MAEVVLIRPGCTDFDEQNRIQGSLDLPLSSRGRAQVDALLEQLQDLPLEIILTSVSEPARSTAAAIAGDLGIPLKESKELRNLNQGLWQGMQIEEVRRKYPKVFKQWQESPEKICPPEGEPVLEALERIRKALGKPLKRGASFGIVASEPLATLISCVIRNCKPELPGSVYGPHADSRVEILRTNGAGLLKGSAAASGTADEPESVEPKQAHTPGGGSA